MWREGAGAGARGDSPAMAEKASASAQSLTKALRVAERKQPMTLPAASLPGRCLRQLLSLSMSLTAHRPCFFRKLFFPSSLSMETQNSNRKEKKKRKNSQAPSGPAKPSPGSALTARPGTGRAPGASETAFWLRAGVFFQFRKAGFPQALEFILPLVPWWLKHGPLSLWSYWSGGKGQRGRAQMPSREVVAGRFSPRGLPGRCAPCTPRNPGRPGGPGRGTGRLRS